MVSWFQVSRFVRFRELFIYVFALFVYKLVSVYALVSFTLIRFL